MAWKRNRPLVDYLSDSSESEDLAGKSEKNGSDDESFVCSAINNDEIKTTSLNTEIESDNLKCSPNTEDESEDVDILDLFDNDEEFLESIENNIRDFHKSDKQDKLTINEVEKQQIEPEIGSISNPNKKRKRQKQKNRNVPKHQSQGKPQNFRSSGLQGKGNVEQNKNGNGIEKNAGNTWNYKGFNAMNNTNQMPQVCATQVEQWQQMPQIEPVPSMMQIPQAQQKPVMSQMPQLALQWLQTRCNSQGPLMQQNPILQPSPPMEQRPMMQPSPQMQQSSMMQPWPQMQQSSMMQPWPQMQQSSTMQPSPQMQQSSMMQPWPQIQQSSMMQPWPQMQQSSMMQPWPQMQQSSTMQPWPQMQQSSTMQPWPQMQQSSTMQPRPLMEQRPVMQPRPLMVQYPPMELCQQMLEKQHTQQTPETLMWQQKNQSTVSKNTISLSICEKSNILTHTRKKTRFSLIQSGNLLNLNERTQEVHLKALAQSLKLKLQKATCDTVPSIPNCNFSNFSINERERNDFSNSDHVKSNELDVFTDGLDVKADISGVHLKASTPINKPHDRKSDLKSDVVLDFSSSVIVDLTKDKSELNNLHDSGLPTSPTPPIPPPPPTPPTPPPPPPPMCTVSDNNSVLSNSSSSKNNIPYCETPCTKPIKRKSMRPINLRIAINRHDEKRRVQFKAKQENKNFRSFEEIFTRREPKPTQ